MIQLIRSGGILNVQVQTFTITDESELDELPLNIPMGSTALLIKEDGVEKYILRKTENKPDNGEWIKVPSLHYPIWEGGLY